MNANEQTTLILGGGVGGLVAANALRNKLGKTHRVVLVEKALNHLFTPSLLWLMTGLRRAEKIQRELTRLQRKGIEVVRGEISMIDPPSRTIQVNGETLQGEFMVISLGAELAPESIPGLTEGGHNIYTLPGCEAFRDAFKAFDRGKLAVLVSSVPYKCPAAPYEAAMLMAYDLRKRKVRERVQIDLFAAEPGPMGVAGPELSAAVRRMVEERGIAYHPEHVIERVDPTQRRLVFAGGTEAGYDLLAYIPPHRAPTVVQQAGLVGESGWVSVHRETLETSFPHVYAIGDVTAIPLKLGKPLPKAGTFAHSEAEVVAQNIACQVTGKGRPERFDGAGECFIEMGDGKAGFARGNFYAEPVPKIKMYKPGRHWHVGKVLFEKDWLRRWF